MHYVTDWFALATAASESPTTTAGSPAGADAVSPLTPADAAASIVIGSATEAVGGSPKMAERVCSRCVAFDEGAEKSEKMEILDTGVMTGGPVKIARGEEIGQFKLGSTVVMIMEVPESFQWEVVSVCGLDLSGEHNSFGAGGRTVGTDGSEVGWS